MTLVLFGEQGAFPLLQVLQATYSQAPTDTAAVGKGPRKALLAMDFGNMTAQGRKAWVEESRLQSILGSCHRSLPSLRSGIRWGN
jgi:hypothetical protein